MDPVQKAVISHTFGVPSPLKKKLFISCNICHLRFNSAVRGAVETCWGAAGQGEGRSWGFWDLNPGLADPKACILSTLACPWRVKGPLSGFSGKVYPLSGQLWNLGRCSQLTCSSEGVQVPVFTVFGSNKQGPLVEGRRTDMGVPPGFQVTSCEPAGQRDFTRREDLCVYAGPLHRQCSVIIC